jgi:hypothetical protein
MPSIIFVGGLDTRPSDHTVKETIDLYLSKGWGEDIDLKCHPDCLSGPRSQNDKKNKYNGPTDPNGTAFRHTAATSLILKAISDNPGIPIVVFSAGCSKSSSIAQHLKSIGQPLTLLHINEPYKWTNASVPAGVPAKNVYSGGYFAAGSGVNGATTLPDKGDHWQSNKALAKYIRANLGSSPAQNQQQPPQQTQEQVQNTPKKLTPEEEAKIKKDAEEAERKKKLAKEPEAINSKIILKKVSGPGELVGVTEADVRRGLVEFKGLQFTEPGTYVISVSGTSHQLLPTSFTVSVLPSEEIVEQPPSGNEEAPISGTRPIIAQIDEPTIKIEPMTYVATDDQPNKETSGSLGLLPFVYYGKSQIQPSDIQRLGIFYDEFVPKCFITFQDTMGLVNSPQSSPTANSTIEIFLNSGSADLKPIHLKFLIDQKKDNKNGTISIFGKLDLKDFYKISYSSYTGTSFQTLRTISKELGLGFNSNIVETNDSMRWLRSGENFETFIRGIITKSYISDSSFMVGYIDYYYCFNYVDVEKEYNRQNTTDIGIISTGVSLLSPEPDDKKTSRLILTNDKAANASPFYFSKFTFINNATIQITNEGVTTDAKAYDRDKKNFLKFKVDSLSSSDDKLKTLRSEDDINTNFRTEFTGKMDTDNVHENYLYAITQNKRNLINLCNIMADLILPIPNFNIYKFQKISVVFTNDKSTPSEPDVVMTRYTGDWIILDIGFSYQKSALIQTVRIARKELTKTEKEIQTETTVQDNSQNNEINENNDPEAKAPVANSSYEVGQQVYIEQNGRLYILTVENVSENGVEISGKIKKAGFGVPADYENYTPGIPVIKEVPPEPANKNVPPGQQTPSQEEIKKHEEDYANTPERQVERFKGDELSSGNRAPSDWPATSTVMASFKEVSTSGGKLTSDYKEKMKNYKYSNILYSNGIVGSSKPGQDRINPNLLADLDRAAAIAGAIPIITTAITGHAAGSRHNPSGLGIDIAQFVVTEDSHKFKGSAVGYSYEPGAKANGIYDDIKRFEKALEKLGYKYNEESGYRRAFLSFGFKNHHHHVHVSNVTKPDNPSV